MPIPIRPSLTAAPAREMTRHLTPRRILIFLAATALAVHIGHDTLGSPHGTFAALLGKWFQPVVFLGCGLAVLLRASHSDRRAPWLLIGAGLSIYAGGSVYYDLAGSGGAAPPFP